VRALSFQPEFPVELHAHDPAGTSSAGPLEVKSFLNHEANVLKFKGTQLVFTRKSKPSSATDINEHVGKVEFPANTKSVILLFLPESLEHGNFHSRVIAIDDTAKAFPAGSFKLANFAKCPVKIELDKETYEVAPGETKLIAKTDFGVTQAASMRAYCKSEDQWQMISTGSWPNPGSKRVLQIFTEDLASKQIELKGIRDVAVP